MGLYRNLVSDYGKSYLGLLFVMYFGIKGFTGALLRSVALPYFQRLHHVELGDFHKLYIVALIVPWCLKPLFGMLSDVVPIGGYRKRYYVTMASILLAVSVVVLAHANPTMKEAMVAFSMGSTGIMVCDLLMEASYSEKLRTPGLRVSGNMIVSYVWILVLIGGVIGAVLVGTLADHGKIETSVWLGVPAGTIMALLALFGDIPENVVVRSCAAAKGRMDLIIVCVSLSLTAIIGAWLLFEMDAFSQMMFMVTLAALVLLLTFAVLPRTLALCNTFMFLADMLWIDFTGATGRLRL